jgi:hypothetical protein
MKADPNIDEMLCSFIDGELPLRQRTEIQRLAARDPDVARRLRQLQDTKTLINALPREEAPVGMLEQVQFSLERRALLDDQPGRVRAGARHLLFRKLVATAAMIALLAVLGAVVYQIVAPVSHPAVPPMAANEGGRSPIDPVVTQSAAPTVVADAGFSGRLEIQTAALIQVDMSVKRAIEENGLSDFVQSDIVGNRRVYRLVSTRDGVKRLVASLDRIWPNFDAATLQVDRPGEYANPVVVETVTAEQTISVVGQDNTRASVEQARNYAVLNGIARDMPGREVLEVINDDMDGVLELTAPPKPYLAQREEAKTTLPRPKGDAEASLTIVLLGTK